MTDKARPTAVHRLVKFEVKGITVESEKSGIYKITYLKSILESENSGTESHT